MDTGRRSDRGRETETGMVQEGDVELQAIEPVREAGAEGPGKAGGGEGEGERKGGGEAGVKLERNMSAVSNDGTKRGKLKVAAILTALFVRLFIPIRSPCRSQNVDGCP